VHLKDSWVDNFRLSSSASAGLKLCSSELFEHAFKREMAIAIQYQLPDFLPINFLFDVQVDPAVMAHVGRYRIAITHGQESLLIDANPHLQAETLIIAMDAHK